MSKRFRAHIEEDSFDLSVDGQNVTHGDDHIEAQSHGLGRYTLSLNGKIVNAIVERPHDGPSVVWIEGHRIEVDVKDERDLLLERYGLASAEQSGHFEVKAPMPGLVVRVLVGEGATVARGDGLVVLEAMKMENEIRADADGVVKTIHVSAGQAVGKNTVLLEYEAD